MSDENQNNYIFSEKAIENFTGFYSALKRVHDRLVREGYEIKNGEIKPPPDTQDELCR